MKVHAKLMLSIIGMGLMPLQLLNLGVAIPYVVRRALFTRTPRGTSLTFALSQY
jgi:hypothetical protein